MSVSRIIILFAIYSLSSVVLLSGCAGTPVIYPHTSGHAGALRVTEIMGWKSGPELPEIYRQALRESGISDVEIQLGSIGVGRVYCCGSSNETDNIIMVFIPKDVPVELGDIVEVKMGEAPGWQKSGIVNVATKVREKNAGKEIPRWGSAGDRGNRSCRWIPENPNLWARILYCDWMKKEGWVEYQGFLWKTWLKPQQ